MLSRSSLLLLMWFFSYFNPAYAVETSDHWVNLHRAAVAGQKLVFSGQYTHQSDKGLSSFLIYRKYDQNRLKEKRVALNGVPREVIKTRQGARFYTVEPKGLLIAKLESIRFFPSVLPLDTKLLKTSYDLKKQNADRVAGRPCQWFWLIPYDSNRYGLGLCVDNETALPLIQVFRHHSGAISEVNAFTNIEFKEVPSALVESNPDFQIEDELRLPPELKRGYPTETLSNSHYLGDLPKGFFILTQKEIQIAKNQKAHHYVIGDGLVNVSLFVEPGQKQGARKGMSHIISGALSMGKLDKGDFTVTAVGDLPPVGLLHLLKSLQVK